MSTLVQQTTSMLSLLPEEDVSIVYTLVKKLIRAWDPDFTKLTPEEKEIVEKADAEIKAGDFLTEDEIWS